MRQLRVSTLEGDRKRKKETYKVVNSITTLYLYVSKVTALSLQKDALQIFVGVSVNCCSSVKFEKQNKMEEQICIRGAVVRFEVKNKKENQSKSKKPHNFFSLSHTGQQIIGRKTRSAHCCNPRAALCVCSKPQFAKSVRQNDAITALLPA